MRLVNFKMFKKPCLNVLMFYKQLLSFKLEQNYDFFKEESTMIIDNLLHITCPNNYYIR